MTGPDSDPGIDELRRSGDLDQRKLRRTLMAAAVVLLVAWVMFLGAVVSPEAHAAERVPSVRVAQVSTIYRVKIEREAARNFGLDAPAARLAAQVHQESGFNPRAASAFANGLAQFTPATARWLPTVCPAVGPVDAWDPDWSLRAQACYMAWLYKRVLPYKFAGAMNACTHWNFALRGYNGGEGWLNKERMLTQRSGGDANAWSAVERYRVRAAWAHKENIGYPRRILLTLEPAYSAAGWPGKAVCT